MKTREQKQKNLEALAQQNDKRLDEEVQCRWLVGQSPFGIFQVRVKLPAYPVQLGSGCTSGHSGTQGRKSGLQIRGQPWILGSDLPLHLFERHVRVEGS